MNYNSPLRFLRNHSAQKQASAANSIQELVHSSNSEVWTITRGANVFMAAIESNMAFACSGVANMPPLRIAMPRSSAAFICVFWNSMPASAIMQFAVFTTAGFFAHAYFALERVIAIGQGGEGTCVLPTSGGGERDGIMLRAVGCRYVHGASSIGLNFSSSTCAVNAASSRGEKMSFTGRMWV